MSNITIDSLYNSIQSVKQSVNNIAVRVSGLEQISSIYVTRSELNTSIGDLNNTISDLNTAIRTIETRLQMILLPEDTRYYLQESEITDFRNHFRQLRAAMSEVEKSRQAMVRLLSRYNLTNSTL